MELKVLNGDYVLSPKGRGETVSDLEELAQRIFQKLSAKRGEFLPLLNFGSRLYKLHLAKPSQRLITAQQYIYEALEGEEGLELSDLSIEENGAGKLVLNLKFSYEGQEIPVLNQEIEV